MPRSRNESAWRAGMRTGILVSAFHLAIWAILLLAGQGSAGQDWNLFERGTVWHDAYGIVNAPVTLACARLVSSREVAVSYGFHLIAFALWWFLLGTSLAAASRVLRSAWSS